MKIIFLDKYKDEDKLLDAADDVDKVYVEQVLPGKMKWNLGSIEKFTFWGEIKVMFMTVLAVLGKEYGDEVEMQELIQEGEYLEK